MINRLFRRFTCSLALCSLAIAAHAGIDIAGPVERVQIAGDGNLWFSMDTTAASKYCKAGWNGMTMFIPKDHPQYPYYFAMLVAAASKGKTVYVGNISIYDGTVSCDITKTGYGLVFYQ